MSDPHHLPTPISPHPARGQALTSVGGLVCDPQRFHPSEQRWYSPDGEPSHRDVDQPSWQYCSHLPMTADLNRIPSEPPTDPPHPTTSNSHPLHPGFNIQSGIPTHMPVPSPPAAQRPRRGARTATHGPRSSVSSHPAPHHEQPPNPPSILVREKKQKAYTNCRRVKLKCIVSEGESDCVRCKFRKERCVFFPRTHDEERQQNLTTDVYTALSHLANVSSAVQHVLHHLTEREIIPPFVQPDGHEGLETYEAPRRELQVVEGWPPQTPAMPEAGSRGRKRKRQKEDENQQTVLDDENIRTDDPHDDRKRDLSNSSHSDPLTSPTRSSTSALSVRTPRSPALTVVPEPPYPPQLGVDDPRKSIIKNGIISNAHAFDMVTYFHANVTPFLFGYELAFGKFPYHPQGPTAITPFILSVMCLVASERVKAFHPYRSVIGDAVTHYLKHSPADSFAKPGDDDDELDPETGIGPEEIVATCILAMFMDERKEARTIAGSAIKWATGWIKYQGMNDSVQSLGEIVGTLPEVWKAGEKDMARIWLLSYSPGDGVKEIRDPTVYCHFLIPSQTGVFKYSVADVLLTFHARLVYLLQSWMQARKKPPARDLDGYYLHLTTSFNAGIDHWAESLAWHGIDESRLEYLKMYEIFTRILVEHSNGRAVPESRSKAGDAARQLLEICRTWHGGLLTNLPHSHLFMITLAGQALTEAVRAQACRTSPQEGRSWRRSIHTSGSE
ncbi:hypothetical protein P7C73_g5834, partial [Tremellales sp. Uapishka_1]